MIMSPLQAPAKEAAPLFVTLSTVAPPFRPADLRRRPSEPFAPVEIEMVLATPALLLPFAFDGVLARTAGGAGVVAAAGAGGGLSVDVVAPPPLAFPFDFSPALFAFIAASAAFSSSFAARAVLLGVAFFSCEREALMIVAAGGWGGAAAAAAAAVGNP